MNCILIEVQSYNHGSIRRRRRSTAKPTTEESPFFEINKSLTLDIVDSDKMEIAHTHMHAAQA
ncbi:MAG: hypothetical protein ABR572_13285, partial [Cryomorphaceae bacterium]